MEPYKTDSTHADTILSGAGSSQRKHGDATTAIYLNVSFTNQVYFLVLLAIRPLLL